MNRDCLNILLVEDDEDDYVMTRDIIEEIEGLDIHLDWINSYEDAGPMMDRNCHNIYLVDYRLGEGNGLDLLKSVRSKGSSVPVIMLTGQDDQEIDIEAMEAGASDYLIKGEVDAVMLGRSIRYALNIKDKIDDLKDVNERLMELDRMKSELVANVSHELRTPLTSIKSFTEILLDELETLDRGKAKHYLEIMNDQTDRLARLIDDFLDIRKIEIGKSSWHDKPVDMSALLKSSVEQYNSAATNKGLSIIFDEVDDPPIVRVDHDRIMQVMGNLLSNAIKFSEKGGKIKVRLALKDSDEKEEGNGLIVVSVSDEGIGILPGDHDKIFERFLQADSSATRKTGGTGLGLAICKEIIKHYGGSVWAESGPDKGSKFSFTLPHSSADEST